MTKTNLNTSIITFVVLFVFICNSQKTIAQTFCTETGKSQFVGTEDGYRYELWNQNGQGTACMTLGENALFSGEWNGILNYLARRGLGYDQTQEHQEIGDHYAVYDCDYNPSSASGNSYLSIYGWTVDPLIEFYIVEDWRNWIPSMANGATTLGSFTVNGSVYDIVENTRVNQPSIQGTKTFQQYFSIRRDKRNSGQIDISEHFRMWESLGLELGKMFEVSFVVEGYQSNGNFNFNELDVLVGDNPTLSTKDISKIDTPITVFPNPSSGKVSITLDNSITKATIKIHDILGKLILSQNYTSTNPIEIPHLKSGTYIVTVTNNTLNYTTKLLVK